MSIRGALVLLFIHTALFAGDASMYELIGFSADGKYGRLNVTVYTTAARFRTAKFSSSMSPKTIIPSGLCVT